MRLIWDKIGERFYETGVSKAVLYLQNMNGEYSNGVAWNGIIDVTETPSGAEASPLYADDIKYLSLLSNEEFGVTIEAYTYPNEFAECNGEIVIIDGVSAGQQKRIPFAMTYQTKVGNDIDFDLGYKIHLIYGALAAPSEKAYTTINDSPEAITFSWEVTTTPVKVTGFFPTSSLIMDSTKIDPNKLAIIEDILYGSETEEARILLPEEISEIINRETPDEPDTPDTPDDPEVEEITVTYIEQMNVSEFENKTVEEVEN